MWPSKVSHKQATGPMGPPTHTHAHKLLIDSKDAICTLTPGRNISWIATLFMAINGAGGASRPDISNHVTRLARIMKRP